ncbi:MAG TPA: hypothetical protein VN925_03345, partial [Steroidobacteraceae bacterium]|nr:hypothetical protein [Steroidobacteraceae bacterium]
MQHRTGPAKDIGRVGEPAARVDPALLGDPAAVKALAEGRLGDPFALLGPRPCAHGTVVRAYLPPAQGVEAIDRSGARLATLQPLQTQGLFAAVIPPATAYRLRIHWPGGQVQETEDPYSF